MRLAKGVFVNGIFTNGENIADLGGVNIAYDALQLYLKQHGKVQKISGYTQEQRFFISWATVWRGFSTQKHLLNQVKTDPHTPQYIRAFAPLTNVDAWYKAFGVKKEDKLYRALRIGSKYGSPNIHQTKLLGTNVTNFGI